MKKSAGLTASVTTLHMVVPIETGLKDIQLRVRFPNKVDLMHWIGTLNREHYEVEIVELEVIHDDK